jgi:hypothetical protein
MLRLVEPVSGVVQPSVNMLTHGVSTSGASEKVLPYKEVIYVWLDQAHSRAANRSASRRICSPSFSGSFSRVANRATWAGSLGSNWARK